MIQDKGTNHPAPLQSPVDELESIRECVLHQTHFLPSQGPIKVFVHHNTLHAFEDRSFFEGVLAGLNLYGSQPYFSEERYRTEFQSGRIRIEDIQAVLLEDLDESADSLVASFGTVLGLRMAMLQFPMNSLPDRELQWLLTESDTLRKFREEVDPQVARQMIERTRRQTIHERSRQLDEGTRVADYSKKNFPQIADGQGPISSTHDFQLTAMDSWSEATWEAYTLHLLWKICQERTQASTKQSAETEEHVAQVQRPQEKIAKATGTDIDTMVHEVLIRFSSAYLDQGFAAWQLPERDEGFLHSFARLYCRPLAVLPAWLKGLKTDLQRLLQISHDPAHWILDSMNALGVSAEDREAFILKTLLALPGWAGMIWQMETSAPWTPKPARKDALLEFLAIRLLLDKHAVAYELRHRFGKIQLQEWKRIGHGRRQNGRTQKDSIAFGIFQLAQARGWAPYQLRHLKDAEWERLIREIAKFSSLERRRILHLAYERKYRNEALDAVAIHSAQNEIQVRRREAKIPVFQVITCIDDREESFRRHLEEVVPECETFGAAGFFAVVMYYRGAAEAHYRPLCPINIIPKHFVLEEPVFSASNENDRRTMRRKMIGKMSRQVHSGSRTMVGGLVTGIFGSLATFPLVARILAPRITARLRESIGGFVRPPSTELHLQRTTRDPGDDYDSLGYTVQEMAGIVVRILQDIGLVKGFSPIVLFLGHGSSSLNNPHESAYNCGACSGGRGGPNARAFAWMANDPHVRALVAESGIVIPDDVRFVGGYHNTCNDRVEYHDLDQLPRSHRPLFREMEEHITEARRRNALERSRRFESAPLSLTPEEALAHVEERSEDLSQARPEYNHATNALCFVGERRWSRGLFLDRRAFLASYDPSIDDANGRIVERILQAAIPVCGGISLEYYFSTVDPEGYGCGSKLPHNITSLAGVMTGAASDLRPGLSQQMVEIHEPLRILFVVQTTPPIMQRIIKNNPAIKTLVEGNWVQLALLDAKENKLLLYEGGQFNPYVPHSNSLPEVTNSCDWFRGSRQHLGFASITASFNSSSLEGKSTGVIS